MIVKTHLAMEDREMNRFYFVEASPRKAQSVVFATGANAVAFLSHMRSTTRGWSNVPVELVKDPDAELVGVCNALCMVSSFLIVCNLGKQAISSIVRSDEIEWISANYCGKEWWAAHSALIVDAVSEESSVFDRAASGKIMAIQKLTIDESKVPDRSVFRLGMGLSTFPPVVSKEFQEIWLSSGLSGLEFVPIASR
jgi:hypothetical protein